MKVPENIVRLIEKYQSGTATKEELQELNGWYHSFAEDEVEVISDKSETALTEGIHQRLLEYIRQTSSPVIGNRRKRWYYAAAAVLLLGIAGAIYQLLDDSTSPPGIAVQPAPSVLPVNDIAPGGDKAVLQLADGSTIILDSASNGLLTSQGSIKVEKQSNGLLVYTINGKQISESDEAFYNTITTPRGGQYQVTLSDGTRVWLNAASSIRFPVLFTGADRKVMITGEAYFEVAKNATRPFKVKTGRSEIEVLGTHFNVNAYDDEPAVRTTLLEGLVKVSVADAAGKPTARFLKPGQQSGITGNGEISVLNNADLEEAVAWKNGRFQFRSADLKTVLRQISRWYDVDVEYKGNVNLHFTGQLIRDDYVSRVFEKLALTGVVHFRIEGKKIIVSP
ncbi:MAG: FecR domain-containing protein [Chitinophagales bacterium]|nr:FecR domain-containing protein [Chitinophagales bacterium]